MLRLIILKIGLKLIRKGHKSLLFLIHYDSKHENEVVYINAKILDEESLKGLKIFF